jgi:hypothetical protein
MRVAWRWWRGAIFFKFQKETNLFFLKIPAREKPLW